MSGGEAFSLGPRMEGAGGREGKGGVGGGDPGELTWFPVSDNSQDDGLGRGVI